MAAAALGIFTHAMSAGQVLSGTAATPAATTASAMDDTSSTSSSDANSATISANDFLTLLVTEMQNQDPTADTDPNEYINQLVNVNSLEQLIDINQNISTALGDSSTTTGGTGATQATGAASALTGSTAAATTAQLGSSAHKAGTLAAIQPALSTATSAGNLAALTSAAVKRTPGNLSVPDATPASQRVAHALDGHASNSRPDIQSITAGSPAVR